MAGGPGGWLLSSSVPDSSLRSSSRTVFPSGGWWLGLDSFPIRTSGEHTAPTGSQATVVLVVCPELKCVTFFTHEFQGNPDGHPVIEDIIGIDAGECPYSPDLPASLLLVDLIRSIPGVCDLEVFLDLGTAVVAVSDSNFEGSFTGGEAPQLT